MQLFCVRMVWIDEMYLDLRTPMGSQINRKCCNDSGDFEQIGHRVCLYFPAWWVEVRGYLCISSLVFTAIIAEFMGSVGADE